MYLKSLSLRGFKSFAGSTTLEFEQGINAVVGPNGSGKSNVVDAISWVLGEQGTKNLRAGNMSDVIFSGTAQKQALGRAQVTLTIDNSDDVLPLPVSDVEISRTIFRNGGSEYSINGETARLTDVQQLMASAHVGKSKHSLITQGHIERVLNASASERRELIEEAAGISAYRARAEQTEKKLESMKSNLDRLEDLEAELSSQLEPLGEQAEAARSAREIQSKIRELKYALTAAEARIVEADQKAAQIRSDELGINLARAQQKAEALSEALKQRNESIDQLRQSKDQLGLEKARLERVAALVSKIQAVADERLKGQQFVNTEELSEQLKKSQSEVKDYEEKAGQVEKRAAEIEERKSKSQQEVDKITGQISELENAQAQAETAHQDHQQLIADLTQELARTKANLDRATDEHQRRTDEVNFAQEIMSNFDAETDTVVARLTKLNAELETLKVEEHKNQSVREKAFNQHTRESQKLAELKLAGERARATSETLENALPAQGESEDALFTSISIKKPFHTAISVLLQDGDQAGLNEPNDFGSWNHLTKDALKKAEKSWQLPHKTPVFLTRAQDVVKGADKSLALALYGCYVHEDLTKTQHKELKDFLADHPLVKAVDAQGTLRASYGEFPARGESGVLELFAHAQEAQEKLTQADQQIEEQEHILQQAGQDLESARAQEKENARAIGVLNATIATAQADMTRLTAKAESAEENHKLLIERAEKAQEQKQEAEALYQKTQQKLETAEKAQQPKNPGEYLAEIRALAQQLEEHKATLTTLTAQEEFIQEQLEQAHAQLAQAQSVVGSRQTALDEAEEHNQKLQRQQDVSRSVMARAEKLATALTATDDELQNATVELTSNLEDQLKTRASEQETLETQRRLLESISAQATQLTIELGALTAQWDMLEAKAQEELTESLDDILEKVDEAEDFDAEDAEKQLIGAQKELAHIGAVNPLALEEYNALSERHTYLAEQIRDLKSSRSDMRAIIKELNERINSEFTQAFSETAAHFEKIFARLFPGGEGELTLTDPTDVLNTGVEIHAKPAGKKVKRISLLSGGERALASLALLTAIFAARPTPFYVLDEVEAALDDRNLGRLLDIFKELAEKSQLIIITHKTRTIEIAETMYGISMKDGVSLVLKQSVEQLRHTLEGKSA